MRLESISLFEDLKGFSSWFSDRSHRNQANIQFYGKIISVRGKYFVSPPHTGIDEGLT